MKQNIGKLSEADLKARTRFWNKKGFFGEPTKKQIEKDSMKMQKLVIALKARSFESVMKIRTAIWTNNFSLEARLIHDASESDINHAISTFKIF